MVFLGRQCFSVAAIISRSFARGQHNFINTMTEILCHSRTDQLSHTHTHNFIHLLKRQHNYTQKNESENLTNQQLMYYFLLVVLNSKSSTSIAITASRYISYTKKRRFKETQLIKINTLARKLMSFFKLLKLFAETPPTGLELNLADQHPLSVELELDSDVSSNGMMQ